MEFILIGGAIALYFLPTFLGWHKANGFSILLLNFFLGWTFIGWVVALVWATSAETKMIPNPPRPPKPKVKPSKAEELEKLASLKERGIITQEEFDKEKLKILES